MYLAMATSIIQMIFENYKGKMYFLVNTNLRVQNKLLGKIGVGGTIIEVEVAGATWILTPEVKSLYISNL